MKKERIVWADLLRFIAMFMVIAVHCTDPFNISPIARTNPEYNFWGTAYGAFLRACVPLFVMLTGMLLLPIKIDSSSFYKKRLMRIIPPFLIWSVLYNLFPWFTGVLKLDSSVITDFFVYAGDNPSQSFSDSLKNILMIPFTFTAYDTHMWYIYMLIGLYLFMPILSAWVEKATAKQLRFYLLIWMLSLFLPYMYKYFSEYVFGASAWNPRFDLFYYFAGFNGYLLLGYYLSKYNNLSLIKTLIIGFLFFVVGYTITYKGYLGMVSNPMSTEEDIELFFLYGTPNVLLMTIAVFIMIQKIRINSAFIQNILKNLTKLGFGIYMVHYFFVGPSWMIVNSLNLPVSIQIAVATTLTFAFSWIFAAIVDKLFPKHGKLILG
jgi:surface polysaccharide O-acyltransferase-like enzyme